MAQASSSVSATIGRRLTLKRSLRPCSAAADWIWSMRHVAALGTDRGPRVLDFVELALVVEVLVAGPLLLDHLEELAAAAVARRFVDPVAVARLVGVIAAGDHVHRDPPGVEGIDRRVLAGDLGGRHEAGAMGEQHAEPLGRGEGLVGDDEAVDHRRGVRDQHPVEARRLVGLGERPQVVGLHDRTALGDRLGLLVGEYVTDELD